MPPGAVASGGAATNGGFVKIVAQSASIDIKGAVEGFKGGLGGRAAAVGTVTTYSIPFIGTIRLGGEAIGVGGQGGAGGDVKLCAYDAINVEGRVRGSIGGQGGLGTAQAFNGNDAYAEGGPSNDAGDILIEGLSPGMQVFNYGSIIGGGVMKAGDAITGGCVGVSTTGGDAEAKGGKGHQGGTVKFVQCTVNQPVGTIDAHVGGDGGDATAIGGAGGVIAGRWGWSGGDPTATGGDGGSPGAKPNIPTPTPTGPVTGGLSRVGTTVGATKGTGGTAKALGGPGGTATVASGTGGSSGTGTATGGTGQSGTPATPAPSPAVLPTGATGGVTTTATSTGTQ